MQESQMIVVLFVERARKIVVVVDGETEVEEFERL